MLFDLHLQLHEFLREILKAHCGVQHIQNSCLDFTQNLGKTGVQFMSGEVSFISAYHFISGSRDLCERSDRSG